MTSLRLQGITTWVLVNADSKGTVTLWVKPGWYRRRRTADGGLTLTGLKGWRLWRHRILWGFSGLEDAR